MILVCSHPKRKTFTEQHTVDFSYCQ